MFLAGKAQRPNAGNPATTRRTERMGRNLPMIIMFSSEAFAPGETSISRIKKPIFLKGIQPRPYYFTYIHKALNYFIIT